MENLDALLTEDAKDWCLISRNSWRTLSEFFREFTRTYMDEKFLEEIKQKIKFCNQKRNQDIHPYITEIRKLFTQLHSRKSLEWELRRAYENLRIEYKIYIKRNDCDTFEELEDLGKEWEIELKKSEIKGQLLQITEPKREKNENQNPQNRKQNIPAVTWRPQYQTPYVQRPNLYPAVPNTPQPRFWQEFQPRFRNNQSRFQFNTYDQLIPRINHLTLNRVPSQTQTTIEFPTKIRKAEFGTTIYKIIQIG